MTQSPLAKGMKLGLVLDTAEGTAPGKTPTFREIQELALTAERVGIESIEQFGHVARLVREQ